MAKTVLFPHCQMHGGTPEAIYRVLSISIEVPSGGSSCLEMLNPDPQTWHFKASVASHHQCFDDC